MKEEMRSSRAGEVDVPADLGALHRVHHAIGTVPANLGVSESPAQRGEAVRPDEAMVQCRAR
jgi:hypothetical protein